MPDYTDCTHSIFQDCTFAVCRMVGTHFQEASLYSSEFHSCCLSGAIFSDSTLADTHFYDCVQHRGGFIRSRLRRCNTLDALMTGVTFAESTLDGCSFDDVRACIPPPLPKAEPPKKSAATTGRPSTRPCGRRTIPKGQTGARLRRSDEGADGCTRRKTSRAPCLCGRC